MRFAPSLASNTRGIKRYCDLAMALVSWEQKKNYRTGIHVLGCCFPAFLPAFRNGILGSDLKMTYQWPCVFLASFLASHEGD